ncbi:ATP-binding cassette domain-containing protein [Dyadobacter tibetensis]|uniref:ATP-binding cassette domain-containing protein n=1 Tax=Dyadobacter tibetensis TaxID=1211851 RepID=UPI0004711285|nr:ABC transporter ATP-binding protein [Dyadobacter tibetensis]
MSKKPFTRLWNLVLLDKSDIIAIYFYAILSGLVQLSLPLGIQSIIGFVLGASMVTSIYVLIFLVVIGVAAVGIMQINQMKIIEKIKQKIFTRYALEFAHTIPQFDSLKTDAYYLPEKINRFFDTLNVQKGLSKLLLDVPVASIQIILGLLLLGLYDSTFIIAGVALLLILWLVFYISGSMGIKTSLKESDDKYKVASWLEEMARVINPFKNNHHTQINLKKTDHFISEYLDSKTSHFKILLVQYQVLVAIKVAITATMLIVGTVLLLDQQLNIGEFIAAEIVILMVINAVEKLIINLDSVYDVATGLEKLASVTEPLAEPGGKLLLQSPGRGIQLELKGFSFLFSNSRKMFQGLDLYLPQGSFTTIGTGGQAGKSVLLQALAGYYTQFEGTLHINGLPLGNYDLASYRRHIGMYLNQKDIFIGTVGENILMGREYISPEQIMDMATKLGLDEIISTLPQAFNTEVAPNARNLDSRTIRCILLLRAFIKLPALLLLETPWDGLPEKSRQSMLSYLRSLHGQTTLVIATDEEALQELSDYHYELQNGRLIPGKTI